MAEVSQATKSNGFVSSALQVRRSLLEIGWHRKGLVAICVVVAIILGLIYYIQATRVYQSKASVLVVKKREHQSLVDTRNLSIEDYVATHQALIKSPFIVEEAIKKHKLETLKSFEEKKDEPDFNLTDVIVKSLNVSRQKSAGISGSNILDLSFATTDKHDCVRVINAIVDSYKDFLIATYKDTSDEMVELMTKTRDELLKEMRKLDEDYRKFRTTDAPALFLRSREGNVIPHEQVTIIQKSLTDLQVRKASGKPAADVSVVLEQRGDDGWIELARGVTNPDGRLLDWWSGAGASGTYRLRFDTAAYFAQQGQACFYPEVVVIFAITQPQEHHHVPLLLNSHGYSTYRGS